MPPPPSDGNPRPTAQEARDSLLHFARRHMPTYVAGPHHRAIAEKLEAVERGEIDRLMVIAPPRHGKSQQASVFFPAWYLARNPDKRIIAASYAQALADRFSRQARNIVADESNWPFPDVHLAPDAKAVRLWELAGRRGGYQAVGVGGPATGSGANILLIDDPIKNQEQAESAEYREKVWDWFGPVVYTRLEEKGAIVLINTRWHHDDLAGRLLEEAKNGGDQWDVLHLPALAEEGDPLGREPGDPLWPEKYDLDALLRIKRKLGSRAFTALYQGRPSSEELALFKRHWWRYYGGPPTEADPAPRQLPADLDQTIQSWDMTFKDTKGSDFVVGQVWSARGADRYLRDQVRGRMSFTATLAAVRDLSARWPEADLKLVEDKANGPAVIDTLTVEITGLVPVNPEGGKYSRASAVSPQVEAGNVYLPHPAIAPWVVGFVQEHAEFPTGAQDDQVDAETQALHRLRLAALPFGWYDDASADPAPEGEEVPAEAADPDPWGLDDDRPWWA